MISVTYQLFPLHLQLRHLQGSSPVPVFPDKIRITAFLPAHLRVGKIEYICPVLMDQNIGMGRYRPVVGPAARLC